MYGAFCIISKLAGNDKAIGPILRAKDRFNPDSVPFGYRDLLINIYIPGSKIVGEIQLHHLSFYNRKKRSHSIYKKARLFEDPKTKANIAYDIASKRFGSDSKDEDDDDEKMKGVESAKHLADAYTKDNIDDIIALIEEAEQSERWQDMRVFAKKLATIKSKILKEPLTLDQRELVSIAYKNCTNLLVFALQEHVKDKYYRSMLLNKLENICDEVFTVLTDLAEIVKQQNDTETEVFYLKMAGDYCRKMAYFKPSPDLPYVGAARKQYDEATKAAKKLPPTHTTRLALALNTSVFYADIAEDMKSAIQISQTALDEAIAKIDNLDGPEWADQKIILQLIGDNISLWKQYEE